MSDRLQIVRLLDQCLWRPLAPRRPNEVTAVHMDGAGVRLQRVVDRVDDVIAQEEHVARS
jgi:hypothetical protein